MTSRRKLSAQLKGNLAMEEWLKTPIGEMGLNATCKTLFFVVATELTSSRGRPSANFVVDFANGPQISIPIRCGVEALSLSGEALPLPKVGESWLLWRLHKDKLQRLLVRDWTNSNHNVPILRLKFVPTFIPLSWERWNASGGLNE